MSAKIYSNSKNFEHIKFTTLGSQDAQKIQATNFGPAWR
jgi:hypothetical protein